MIDLVPNNDYILLTPGPLSTSKRVRAALLKDWCTWDNEYNSMIQDIRGKLLVVGKCTEENYTTILMQGSGSFSVEAVIGSAVGENDKILILANGAYGKRMREIANVLKINYKFIQTPEKEQYDVNTLDKILEVEKDITHVAFVHCETTTGILNPLEDLAKVVKKHNRKLIVDAMSSFGGIEIDVEKLDIDFLISSANKCIQGVPGFGFIIAKKSSLMETKGQAKSLALDIYSQWDTMENDHGKWRFTSPTHTTHAFYEALKELEEEGGVESRFNRYNEMQKTLVLGMKELGFNTYVKEEFHSPIITTFLYPKNREFNFNDFYKFLKGRGFVIYPGKLSDEDTFRIGNIGDINIYDIKKLIKEVGNYISLK